MPLAFRKIANVVVLALALLLGCSHSRDLSRSVALGVLNSSAKFTPAGPDFGLTPQQVSCGLKSGLWVPGKAKPLVAFYLGVAPYILTSKGRAVITEIAPNVAYPSGAQGTLAVRRRTAIEITGISDYQSDSYRGKQVDFTWRWNADDMPDSLRACFPTALSTHHGTALFRLYDDGWRVEQIVRQAGDVL